MDHRINGQDQAAEKPKTTDAAGLVAGRLAEARHDKDTIRRIFETGEYPYTRKISRRAYEKQKAALQVELLKVQDWVRQSGQKIVLLFEGRDAAGKGGLIKRLTERVSPRVFRVVALPAPTDREKTQMYVQRYISHFPSAGRRVSSGRSQRARRAR